MAGDQDNGIETGGELKGPPAPEPEPPPVEPAPDEGLVPIDTGIEIKGPIEPGPDVEHR